MWVIIVNDSIQEQRDSRIQDLLSGTTKQLRFLSKKNLDRYSTTTYVGFANIFKTESGATRLINTFNLDKQKHFSSSKFYWINSSTLTLKKLTNSEWNDIIDSKINILERNYNKQRQKLISKKLL
jgi:hypothetical protein